MSLIHEALEKLEQQKSGRKKEPIAESVLPVFSEKKPSEENSKVIYWIGGAVILFFVLGIVYLSAGSLESQLPKTDALPPLSSSENSVPPPTPVSKQGLFSLTGITQSGTELSAIINNELVREGDWVNGARVKSIQSQEVSLEFRGQEINLSL